MNGNGDGPEAPLGRLTEESAPEGLVARIRNRILRRRFAGQVATLSLSTPILVILEYVGLLIAAFAPTGRSGAEDDRS